MAGLMRHKGIGQCGLLPGGSGKESASRLIQVFGGTEFHVVIGLRLISLLDVGRESSSTSRGHSYSLSYGSLPSSSKPATVG